MAQITGSGPGNGTNYVMVDSSVGSSTYDFPTGRLFTDNYISKYKEDYFLGSPLPVRIYNSQTNGSLVGPMALDDSTFANTSITYEHHETHGGAHYNIRGFTVINSGANVSFETTTPNTTKWTHMVFEITGTSQTETRVFEGATVSGGVTTIPFNNNRNSTNTSTLNVTMNPTISGTSPTSGTLIESHSKGLAGATPAKGEIGGTADREDEWVLKSGTTYLWEIKSVDDDNIIDYAGRWYEHTDKVAQF